MQQLSDQDRVNRIWLQLRLKSQEFWQDAAMSIKSGILWVQCPSTVIDEYVGNPNTNPLNELHLAAMMFDIKATRVEAADWTLAGKFLPEKGTWKISGATKRR